MDKAVGTFWNSFKDIYKPVSVNTVARLMVLVNTIKALVVKDFFFLLSKPDRVQGPTPSRQTC